MCACACVCLSMCSETRIEANFASEDAFSNLYALFSFCGDFSRSVCLFLFSRVVNLFLYFHLSILHNSIMVIIIYVFRDFDKLLTHEIFSILFFFFSFYSALRFFVCLCGKLSPRILSTRIIITYV